MSTNPRSCCSVVKSEGKTRNFPKISIITPSYNQGQFIERTIQSVLKQDYPNIEYIVMDGGSMDNTLEILKEYEDRLIWKSEPDRGQSDAINKGFRMATGDVIGWLNSDDMYEPGAIGTGVEYLLKHAEVDLVYGDCNIIDENDAVIGQFEGCPLDSKKAFRMLLFAEIAIPQPTIFFRRTLFDDVGYLDVNIHHAMDADFFVRIRKGKKMGYIASVMANHRLYKQCKTQAWKSTGMNPFFEDYLKILKKHSIGLFCMFYLRKKVVSPVKRMLFGKRRFLKRPESGVIKFFR